MLRSTALTTSLLAGLLLVGCTSLPRENHWPRDLPPRKVFVSAYHNDSDNAQLQDLESYLTWVIRFYDGNGIVGTSWREVTDGIVHALQGDALKQARTHLHRMGRLIASEWAKANEVRVINTRMLSLWGAVMLAADDPEDRVAAMELISGDIIELLDGTRDPRSISESRYEKALALSLGF